MRIRIPMTTAERHLAELARRREARLHGREPERGKSADGPYTPLSLDHPLPITHPLFDTCPRRCLGW